MHFHELLLVTTKMQMFLHINNKNLNQAVHITYSSFLKSIKFYSYILRNWPTHANLATAFV